MKLFDLKLVLEKEFADVLRDRRMLMIILLFPVLICPMSTLLPTLIVNGVAQQVETKITKVALIGGKELEPLLKSTPHLELVAASADPQAMILDHKCDVVVVAAPDFSQCLAACKPAKVTLFDNAYGTYAVEECNVNGALSKFSYQEQSLRLERYHVDSGSLKELSCSTKTVETGNQRSAYWLALVCTLLLVLTMISSSMYPALDTITGERERATLALLLMAPIDRRSTVVAKLIVVAVVTFVAAILALSALAFELSVFVPTTRDLTGTFQLHLPLGNLLASSIFVLPIAISIAAISILLSSYAKTFQQGQSYFTPLMIVGMVLSGLVLTSEDTAPFFMNFVPVANLMLCMHKAIQGQWNWAAIAATLISSTVYIFLLVRLAVGILDDEETLFGIKRAPNRKASHVKDAVILYGLCLVVFFYATPLCQMASRNFGMIFSQLVSCALPAIAAMFFLKLPVRSTLSIRRPSVLSLAGAALLAPSMALAASLIVHAQAGFLPSADSYIKALQDFIMPKGVSPWVAYLTLALCPAICEELLFRGAIQGLLRKSLRRWVLCLVVGLMFGIMHGSSYRLLPTTFMGIALAFLTEYTGSIFPAMILHGVNNALAVYETTHGDASVKLIPLAVIGGVMGLTLLILGARQRLRTEAVADQITAPSS